MSQPDRTFPTLLAFAVMMLIVAMMYTAGSDGPAAQISHDYWRVIAVPAVIGTLVMGWLFQRCVVGTTYRARYTRATRVMSPAGSWAFGIVTAALIMYFGAIAAVHLANRVDGIPYTAFYAVDGKYIHHGRHSTCYGVTMSRPDDPTDRFKVCLSQSTQEQVQIGDRFEVEGRRSRYVNQMVHLTKTF